MKKQERINPHMAGLSNIECIREYCNYVEEHLVNVGKAWTILQQAIGDDAIIKTDQTFWHIHRLIEEHDISKLSISEFIPYAEWFFSQYGKNLGSIHRTPFFEREHKMRKAAFSYAWTHHQACNPHHWENWTKADEAFTGENECHVVCMVVDWMAMGMKFGESAEEYYQHEKENIDLPRWAVDFLEFIFLSLRDSTIHLTRRTND